MKIRTLQLIGGAGRGTCCLLRTAPPVPVSSFFFFLLCHIHCYLYISFFLFPGSSSTQMSMMNSSYKFFLFLFFSFFFLLFSPVINMIWKKKPLMKYNIFTFLILLNIYSLDYELSIIAFSSPHNSHFQNKFSRYQMTVLYGYIK